jgi:predicted  nucleic acid-binding Zn-ribbon protein
MGPAFAVVAIISAYNEADIIDHVVDDLIKQGVHVHFLDDGSTDRTVATVEKYLGRGVLAIERLTDPRKDGTPGPFDWERILIKKTQLAREIDADWFIHHDADEFREGPWPGVSLIDAIRRVDARGFNAIDFASLDFWPTHDRFRAGDDVREAFTSYAESAPYDRLQIRCWKKTADLDLASAGGHEARFPGRNVFPLRFILRHYPIRGQAHGERKIFHERRNRFSAQERARGWHVQYDDVHEGASFLREPSTLTPYDPDAVRLALTLRHRGVEALEASLGEARSAVDASTRELERTREEVVRTRAELDAGSAEAARLRDVVDARTAELAARSVELAARSAELAARSAELAARNAELEARNVEAAALDDAVRARTAELHATRAELGTARATLGARTAELAARNAETAGLRDALDQRLDEIERWRTAVDDQARRLDALHRSASWRWTAPARALYRLLKGL